MTRCACSSSSRPSMRSPTAAPRSRPAAARPTESFPLFGYSLNDYDKLYAEKLELLLAINASERVTWSGTTRPAASRRRRRPAPGCRQPADLAGHRRQPLLLCARRSAGPADLLRHHRRRRPPASRRSPSSTATRPAPTAWPEADIKVSVGSPGYIGETGAAARDDFWPHWHNTMGVIGSQRGFSAPSRLSYDRDTAAGGALFVGSPEEIAERIVEPAGQPRPHAPLLPDGLRRHAPAAASALDRAARHRGQAPRRRGAPRMSDDRHHRRGQGRHRRSPGSPSRPATRCSSRARRTRSSSSRSSR